MSARNNRAHFTGVRVLVATASLVVVIAGLKAAQAMLIPFLFAAFLAILGSAPLATLQRRSVPKFVAIFIVTLMIIAVVAGVGMLLSRALNEFTEALPHYQPKLIELANKVEHQANALGFHIRSSDSFSTLETNELIDVLVRGVRGFAIAFSNVVLVIIIVVFMLFEAASLKDKVRHSVGYDYDFRRFTDTAVEVQRYLAIKTVTSMITGILAGLWCLLMGIEFPLLWGFTAFLLNYIPFIGSIIASIPAIALALLEFGPGSAITLAIGYFCINVGVSNFLEPVLMGRRLGLSPLVVFLSLVFWGWVWGPLGMLLSVPLTMVIKILLEHSEEMQWLAILMDIKPAEVEPRPD